MAASAAAEAKGRRVPRARRAAAAARGPRIQVARGRVVESPRVPACPARRRGVCGGAEGMAASAKPLRMSALANVTQISAGQAHVLAVNDIGVHAWGDNRASSCGVMPTIAVQHKPARIAFA